MYEAICPSLSGRPFISPSVFSIASAVFFALSRARCWASSSSSAVRRLPNAARRIASAASGTARVESAARRPSRPSRDDGGASGRLSPRSTAPPAASSPFGALLRVVGRHRTGILPRRAAIAQCFARLASPRRASRLATCSLAGRTRLPCSPRSTPSGASPPLPSCSISGRPRVRSRSRPRRSASASSSSKSSSALLSSSERRAACASPSRASRCCPPPSAASSPPATACAPARPAAARSRPMDVTIGTSHELGSELDPSAARHAHQGAALAAPASLLRLRAPTS